MVIFVYSQRPALVQMRLDENDASRVTLHLDRMTLLLSVIAPNCTMFSKTRVYCRVQEPKRRAQERGIMAMTVDSVVARSNDDDDDRTVQNKSQK
jgi:hypothetical protein